MTFARLVAVVVALAAVPALATTKQTTKKKAPAKHAHVAAAKKATKKKAAPDHAIASASHTDTKSADSTRLAQADQSPARDTAGAENRDGEDSDSSGGGNRRVITHSTAGAQADTAE